MAAMKRARLGLVLVAALAALRCATIAAEAGDNGAVRPSAQAGPFRGLRADELSSTAKPQAPYLLDDATANYRQESALSLDDAVLGQTALYVVADRKNDSAAIFRFVAPDARSVVLDPATPVLVASQPWEGAAIGEPDAHRVDGEIRVYYSGAGGIGLAHSTDGVVFTREPAPVLSSDGAPAWEGGAAPSSPALLELAPGDFRLFYVANARIGEARSSDGVHFERIGAAPLLEPEGGGDSDDPPFDSDAVGDPCPVVMTSPEGRRVTRIYYAGTGPGGTRAIGMAARFGSDGPLTRAISPVFSAGRDARSPSLIVYSHFTLLYVTENAGTATTQRYPAIAVGIAPGNITIPLP